MALADAGVHSESTGTARLWLGAEHTVSAQDESPYAGFNPASSKGAQESPYQNCGFDQCDDGAGNRNNGNDDGLDKIRCDNTPRAGQDRYEQYC